MPTSDLPSPAQHILILKLGDTLPELAAELGDFEHWVTQGLPRFTRLVAERT